MTDKSMEQARAIRPEDSLEELNLPPEECGAHEPLHAAELNAADFTYEVERRAEPAQERDRHERVLESSPEAEVVEKERAQQVDRTPSRGLTFGQSLGPNRFHLSIFERLLYWLADILKALDLRIFSKIEKRAAKKRTATVVEPVEPDLAQKKKKKKSKPGEPEEGAAIHRE